jgi:hypothetical protein
MIKDMQAEDIIDIQHLVPDRLVKYDVLVSDSHTIYVGRESDTFMDARSMNMFFSEIPHTPGMLLTKLVQALSIISLTPEDFTTLFSEAKRQYPKLVK